MFLPNDEIARALLRFAEARGDATFCPSEVARALLADWRPLMPAVRLEAERLVETGQLTCTQQGITVSPVRARGPIRLARAS
jgi:hypothetical protein